VIKKAAVLTLVLTQIALLIIGVLIIRIKADDKKTNDRLVLPTGFSQILVKSPKAKNTAATISELREELIGASNAHQVNFMVVSINQAPKLNPDGNYAKERSHIFYHAYQSGTQPFKIIGEVSTKQLVDNTVYSNDPEVKSQRRLSANGDQYYFTVDDFTHHTSEGTGYVFVDATNKSAYRSFMRSLRQKFHQTHGVRMHLIHQKAGADMLIAPGSTGMLNVYILFVFLLVVQIVGVMLWGVYLSTTITTFIAWGYTARRIVLTELGKPIAAATFITTGFGLWWQPAFAVIMLAILLMAILTVILIGVTYAVMVHSFTERILNQHRRTVILSTLLAVKILAVVLAVSVVSPMASGTIDHWAKQLTAQSSQTESPFAVVYPLFTGRDQINMALGENTMSLMQTCDRVLYRRFESIGGVLFYPSMRDDNIQHAEFVTVNQNYLRVNPLRDVNGKTVFVGNTKKKVALVPPANQKKWRRILADLKGVYRNDKFSVIRLKAHQTLQTFGPDNAKMSLPSAIIVNSPRNSKPDERPFLSMIGLQVSNKLPITKTTSTKVYASLLQTLRRHGLDDNVQTLIPEKDLPAVELREIFDQQWAYHGQITAAMVLAVTLCILYAVVEAYLNGLRYALMYTMGSSFLRSHRQAIGLFGIEVAGLLVLQLGVFRFSSLVVLLVMILLDFVIQFGVSLYGLKKNSEALFEEE
jgi:hypothetical protein